MRKLIYFTMASLGGMIEGPNGEGGWVIVDEELNTWAKLTGQRMQAGLIEAYRIYIHPVILGTGTRMIPTLNAAVRLRLVERGDYSDRLPAVTGPIEGKIRS